jgi:IMP dehydrogenase
MPNNRRELFKTKKENVTFGDVSLVEGKSIVDSRSEVDLEVDLPKGYSLELPVMTASMDTITSKEMASTVLGMGGAIVHHRYNSPSDRVDLLKYGRGVKTDHRGLNGTAVGYSDSYDDVEKMIKSGADLISLDLAHAWHQNTINWIQEREDLFENTLLVVGNFSHVEGIKWLHDKIGKTVDIVKVSQGGGSACTTRQQAGIGKPTLQAVMDYTTEFYSNESLPSALSTRKLPYEIVADGGIQYPGDIAKSLGAGACAGMIGGMLAGTEECPGKIVNIDGTLYKKYRGMASEEAKEDGNVDTDHVEGVSTKVKLNGSAKTVLENIKDGLRSSISTCGFDNVDDFGREAEFIRLSHNSQIESTPHKLNTD